MNWEVIAFVVYFVLVIGIGVYFFIRSKAGGEKEYFLGGRSMSGPVAALSAGASDMSAWVLLGLPGALYLSGLSESWISIGLFIGTVLAWLLVAPRLRTFSIAANDSITIPQYLTNRFKSSNIALQVVCALVFIIVYCIYAASSISACGDLFKTVFKLSDGGRETAMVAAAIIIVAYTFLGGFNAVCWTDFFQGLLMLAALMAAPIVALFVIKGSSFVKPVTDLGENYYHLLSSGKLDGPAIVGILSGLGWGLGYFGMPHILVRYMSIRSRKEMKRSQCIGILWTFLILAMATVVGIVARQYLGDIITTGSQESMAFVLLVKNIFPALLAGVLLSAILAASMSTADSQLLASSSAFSSDIYKPIRKNASDREVAWAGRIVVAGICAVALFIALAGNSTIMGLVGNAWGAFGAAFGPAILLSLYWKRFNYTGAICGIITGFVVDIAWGVSRGAMVLDKADAVLTGTLGGLYEIIPGFFASLLVCIIVSLCTAKPSTEVEALFDEGVAMTKRDDEVGEEK
ncbi:MAG: sodium/proline symporter [Lachnospiraceae bacterium]|nr:sodium/proline symporter [Lachnospiraceae bacterium]